MKLILYYSENASQARLLNFTFDRFSEKCLSVQSTTHSTVDWVFDILVSSKNIFFLSFNASSELKIEKCSENALNCQNAFTIGQMQGEDIFMYGSLPVFTASGANSHAICIKTLGDKVYCAVTNKELDYTDSAVLSNKFVPMGSGADMLANPSVVNWEEDTYVVGFEGSSTYTLVSLTQTGHIPFQTSIAKNGFTFLSKSRERSKIFIGNDNSVLEFEYSTSFTHKRSTDYDNGLILGFAASFSETKHFLMILNLFSDTVQTGISFESSVLTDQCQLDDNLEKCLQNNSLSADKKIVSQNGTQYFSINLPQNTAQVESITVNQQNQVSATECPGNFIYLGSSKKCLDSCTLPYQTTDSYCLSGCPSSAPFISSVTGFNTTAEKGTCQTNCSNGYVLQENTILYPNTLVSKQYCLLTCPLNFSRVYLNTALSLKECTNSCNPQISTKTRTPPVNYELVVGSETQCVSSCPHYRSINNLNDLNTANNSGICVDNCDNKFSFTHPSASTTKYCTDTCPSIYSYKEVNGTAKRCLESCDQNSAFKYETSVKDCLSECSLAFPFKKYNQNECLPKCDSNQFIDKTGTQYSNLAEIQARELGSECINDCYSFKLHSTLVYTGSSETKNYCLTQCPSTHFSERISAFNKNCVEQCDTSSALKYSTPDRKCVSDCSSEGKPLIISQNNALTCNSSCSQLFPYKKTISGLIHCVASCESGEYIDLTRITSTETTTGLKNHEINSECVSSCTQFAHNTGIKQPNTEDKVYCLANCPSDKPFKANPTGNLPFCYSNCTEALPFKYINGTNCVQNCTSIGKLYIEERENKLFCVDSCQEGTYFKVENNLNICKSHCSQTEFLRLNAENLTKLNLKFKEIGAKCTSSCSKFVFKSENKYLSSNSNKNYCFDACPAGLFTLEDGSKLCVTQCDTLSAHKYRTDEMKCVSSCQTAGYSYVLEDLRCSNTCNDVLDGNICRKACTKDNKYKENGKCVQKCTKPFIKEYYECVDKCPGKFHGNLCVEECNEGKLVSFYTDNGMLYEPRHIALSTGECAVKCTENKAKFLDLDSLTCIHRCPVDTYTTEENVCVPNCTNSGFPFRDESIKQCLSKCRPERPFVLPNSTECIEKCPPDLPNKTEEANKRTQCSKDCSLQQVRKDGFCLKMCPQFYSPNERRECVLDCNPEFGLVKQGEESCSHCFRDQDKFYFQGKCIDFCPDGHSFNQNFVCLPCFSLGLWTNELNRCVKIINCSKNSYFDFENRICGICKRKGWLLLVNQGRHAVCSNEDCSDGHLESENGVEYCYKCRKDQFYLNKRCLTDCPAETTYDLVKKACVPFCLGYCSTGCCFNGRCKNGRCACKTGFTGTRCDIPVLDSTETSGEIRKFTLKRFDYKLLVTNEAETIRDLTEIVANLRVFDKEKTILFLESAITLVKYFNVKGAFIEEIFFILDRLLGLSAILRNRTGLSTYTAKIAGIVDIYSSQINIHNLTPNTEESFEKAFNRVFEGDNLSFRIGFDARTEKRVDLSACIDYSTRFAFKLLRYHINLPLELVPVEERSMLLSLTPRVEYSLFDGTGKVNLNQICSPDQVNKEFPAEISPEQQSLAAKFLDSPVNLFNAADPFFVDRCVPFNEGNKDVTLKERQKYKLDRKSACAETKFEFCTVLKKKEGYHCSCRGLRNRKKSVLEDIAGTFPQSNYVLFGCTKVFSNLKLVENKGFYIIFVPFAFSLLLATFYSFRRNTHLKTNGKYEYLRQDGVLFDPGKMNLKAYFNECAELDTTLVKFGLVMAAKNKSHSITNRDGILPTIPELDSLEPKELFEFDTRSSLRFAIDTIKEEHYLLNTLFKRSLGSTPVFEVLVYFTEINLGITMNAFFIDDTLVENRNSSEEMSLIEMLRTELPKTIWALITSKLLCSLISFFVSEDFTRKAVVSEAIVGGNASAPRRVYDKYLLEERWTQIGFLFCVIGLNCIFIYFVAIYAEVYQNSIGIWIDGIIIGLLVDIFAVELVGPLLIIAAKEIALKYPDMLWLYSAATVLKDFKKLKA